MLVAGTSSLPRLYLTEARTDSLQTCKSQECQLEQGQSLREGSPVLRTAPPLPRGPKPSVEMLLPKKDADIEGAARLPPCVQAALSPSPLLQRKPARYPKPPPQSQWLARWSLRFRTLDILLRLA